MSILKRQLNKQVKKAIKMSDTVNLFVPGMGIVLKSVFKKYDSLTPSKKKKFHSLRSKKEKEKFLKNI